MTNSSPANSSSGSKTKAATSQVGIVFLFAAAAALRLLGFLVVGIESPLVSRYELVSSQTSFKSVLEGQFNILHFSAPYSGETVHLPPTWVLALSSVLSVIPSVTIPLFHTCMDLLVALQLAKLVYSLIDKQHALASATSAVALYLLHPFAIASCLARSLLPVQQLLVLVAINSHRHGRVLLGNMILATVCVPFPVLLPLAMILPCLQSGTVNRMALKGAFNLISVVFIACLCIAFECAVLYFVSGSSFSSSLSGILHSVVLWEPFVHDLSPNAGVIWYLMMEIFLALKPLFIFIVIFPPFAYALPLIPRYREAPGLALCCLLGLLAICRPYQTAGDALPWLALIKAHSHLMEASIIPSIYGVVCIFVSILSPFLWNEWVVTGGGNANFVFALGLVYTIASSLMLSSSLIRARKGIKAVKKNA